MEARIHMARRALSISTSAAWFRQRARPGRAAMAASPGTGSSTRSMTRPASTTAFSQSASVRGKRGTRKGSTGAPVSSIAGRAEKRQLSVKGVRS